VTPKGQGRDPKVFEALHRHCCAEQNTHYYSPPTLKHNFSNKTTNINVEKHQFIRLLTVTRND